jgi:hypothetical protein
MKTLKIIALALCLHVSMTHSAFELWALCPECCGLAPLFIQEGFRKFKKAKDVEKALESRETTSSIEESTAIAPEPPPYGSDFSETYPAARRRSGYAYFTVGTVMGLSALYTTTNVLYKIYNADKQE